MFRDLENEISKFLASRTIPKNVLLLEGARQVGKTFMMERFLKQLPDTQSCIAFNLERSRTLLHRIDKSRSFDEFTRLLVAEFGFAPDKEQILFIDEAQESEQLGSYVRFMKEEWRHKSVILTGSSMTRLFRHSRVPVGRIEYLRLFPYSFREFLRAQAKENLLEGESLREPLPHFLHADLLRLYDDYLDVGGLPAVVHASFDRSNDPHHLRQEIYLSQKDDFYRREVELKQHLFEDATRAIANHLGYPFALARIGGSHRDAKAILSLLEGWHIALRCEQRSFTVSTHFHAKYYLYDVGLAKSLREGTLPRLSVANTIDPGLRTSLGGLVENAIFLALISGKGFLDETSGWKKGPKHQIEVDFVIKMGDSRIPVEVKATQTLQRRHYQNILAYLRHSRGKLGIVISAAPFAVFEEDSCKLVNLPCYLASRDAIEAMGRLSL